MKSDEKKWTDLGFSRNDARRLAEQEKAMSPNEVIEQMQRSEMMCKGEASREKYWDELSNNEERIDRLREELKATKAIIVELCEDIRRLRRHRHLPDGEVVQKIEADRPSGIGLRNRYL